MWEIKHRSINSKNIINQQIQVQYTQNLREQHQIVISDECKRRK